MFLNCHSPTGLTLAALEIRDVMEADYGDYSCVGSNKFGQSTAMTLQLSSKLFSLQYSENSKPIVTS